MIKKKYQKPTTKVIPLQQHAHILAGSVKGYPGGYNPNGGNPEDAG